MKEILGVADDPPARRRWFHDDFFDLFVWQAGGEVTLFQLCYGADSAERALVWDKQRGFFHDGPASRRRVFARFDDAAAALPEDIGARCARRCTSSPAAASRCAPAARASGATPGSAERYIRSSATIASLKGGVA